MRLLIAAFFVALICAVAITPAQAQTAVPLKPLQDTATEIVASKTAQIVGCQDAFKASRGKYMQVLWTSSTTPTDGKVVVSDQLTLKPYYQTESAELFFTCTGIKTDLPARLRVDTYDGPNGHGFSVTLEVMSGKEKYQRTLNFGAEIYRERDWAEVVAKP
jgi:hypothetical protein